MKTLILVLLICTSFALYDQRSKVIQLTSQNFKDKVLNSKGLWMVEFFAPWCGHCKNLAPEYEKLAKQLEGIVNIGAVDADTYKDLGGQYGVKGFPTLKFFGDNKNSPSDYQGERNAQAMLNYLLDQVKSTVSSRSGQKSSSGSSRQKSSSSSTQSDGDVIILEESNFDSNVKNSKDSWFVEFYAPWCGHCKKLEPEWNKVATDLKGKVKVAKVDATVATGLASRFGVSGYPTIKFFPAGFQRDSDVQPFEGSRDAASMTEWALEQSNKSKKVEVTELINKDILQEQCVEYNGLCIIAFLPHIYDSSKEERNQYINTILESAKALKNKPVAYLWTQGGDNFEFEEALQSSAGYPGLLAISFKKNVFAKMKGVFNKANIDQFVNNALTGRASFSEFKQLPAFKSIPKWDGQSHQYPSGDDDL